MLKVGGGTVKVEGSMSVGSSIEGTVEPIHRMETLKASSGLDHDREQITQPSTSHDAVDGC